MRRLLLTIVLTSFATGLVWSQQVHIGPMMGLNISNIHIDESFTIDNSQYEFSTAHSGAGVMVGAYSEFSYRKFFLQPQLVFSQNQSHINFTTEHSTTEQRMTVHQLQMPIMMGYAVNKMFKMYAGPMITRFVDASMVPTYQDLFASYTQTMDKTQMGYQVGFGVTFNKATFALQMRSSFDEANIQATFMNQLLNFRQQDQVIQFAFSYRIFKKDYKEAEPKEDIFFTPEDVTVSTD